MMLKLNTKNSLPLLNRSIKDIHQLLLSKQKLNSNDLLEICHQRIQDVKILNAFITETTDSLAKELAQKSTERYAKGKPLSLLDGIPISIKDNFSIQNIRTTCASKMLSTYHPPFNATVVQKLIQSGAVICGKTNMDEFAMGSACSESFFGPTYHPWNSSLKFRFKFPTNDTIESEHQEDQSLWYITGGSSGGSAVSVATGSAFASISSDTGGSTRNPASRLGIVGFKPSYGLISRFGLIPLTHSLDVPGIMARTVEDVQIIFECLQGIDDKDSTTVLQDIKPISELNLNKITIGIPKEYEYEHLCPEIGQSWQEAAKRLMEIGCKIKQVSLPHTKYSLPCYSILNTSEVASNFACYDGIEYGHRTDRPEHTLEDCYSNNREESLNDIVKSRIIAGNYFLLTENYQKFYKKALKVRRLICKDFEQVFNSNVDFLLTPVCITSTMNYRRWNQMDKTEEAIREDYCTQPVNMAGIPAITIPFKLDKNNHNLPIGLQLIGKKFDDYRLLMMAKYFETIVQFPSMEFIDEIH